MVQQVSHSLVYKTYSLTGKPSHPVKNYMKYTDESACSRMRDYTRDI